MDFYPAPDGSGDMNMSKPALIQALVHLANTRRQETGNVLDQLQVLDPSAVGQLRGLHPGSNMPPGAVLPLSQVPANTRNPNVSNQAALLNKFYQAARSRAGVK